MPEVARIRIRGEVYRAQSIEDISLDDLLMFDAQAADAGYDISFDAIQEIFNRVEAEGKDAKLTIREAFISQALVVWLTLRAAGQPITFAEAAKIPPSQIDELPPTGDRQAPKAKTSPSSSSEVSSEDAGADDTSPSDISSSMSVSA